MDAYLFWKNIDEARKGKRPLKDVCKQFGITYQRIADQRSECRFPKLEVAIAKACEQAKDGILESIEKLLDIDPKKETSSKIS